MAPVLAAALLLLGSIVPGSAAGAAPESPGTAAALAPSAATGDPGSFQPLPARRILDTRSGLGAPAGVLPAGSRVLITAAGRGGIPDTGVGAVAVTLTATGATAGGWLTAAPAGQAIPSTSTLNFRAGATTSNLTIVPVDADGRFTVAVGGTGTVHVLADVAGYVTAGQPSAAGAFVPVPASRIVDTRTGWGAPAAAALPKNGVLHVSVAGHGGVPDSGAGAALISVTVTRPTAGGWLTAFSPVTGPGGRSTVNFGPGQTVANLAAVELSPTGTLDVAMGPSASGHVLVDVVGWVIAGPPSVEGALNLGSPQRLLDTRTAGGMLTAGEARQLWLPATSRGSVLNVTATGASGPGFLTVSTTLLGTPYVSHVSFATGASVAAAVVVPADTSRSLLVTVSPGVSVHVVVDQVGTITGQPMTTADPLALSGFTAAPRPGGGLTIGWAVPAPPVTSVVVRRSATGVAPSSPYAGQSAWSGPAATAGFVDPRPAPGVQVVYAAFARDAAGNFSPVVHADATPTPLAWHSDPVINPVRGRPTDVSCPTATWCMAVDASGRALTFDGTRWSAPTAVPGLLTYRGRDLLTSVSCSSVSFCMATTGTGEIAVHHGGTWSLTPLSEDIVDVSCAADDDCTIALGSILSTKPTTLVRWTRGTMSAPMALPGAAFIDSISCPSVTLCFVGGRSRSATAYVWRVSGTTVTARAMLAGRDTQSVVTCPTTTFCMFSTRSMFATMNGATWSTLRPLADPGGWDVRADDLDCSTPANCTASGHMSKGHWDGRTWAVTWTVPLIHQRPTAVACGSPTLCLVIDQRGMVTRWTGSGWTPRGAFDPTYGGVRDLACDTASSCHITDDSGNVLRWNAGAVSRTALFQDRAVIDCPAPGRCLASSLDGGRSRVLSAGRWGPTLTGEQVSVGASACPTTTLCLAVGFGTWSRTDASGRWVLGAGPLPVNVGQSPVIDCAGPSFCLAIGQETGNAVRWTGTSWVSAGRVALPVGAAAQDIDCPSPSFCLVVGGNGESAVYAGGVWRAVAGRNGPLSLSCASASLCVGTSWAQVLLWDGLEWGASSTTLPTEDVALVDCTAGHCFIAGGTFALWF